MPPALKKCWCGKPHESKSEIQCSKCKSWCHYICCGLSLKEVSECINTASVLYFCRKCTELDDFNEVAAAMIEEAGVDAKFRYRDVYYHLANADDGTIETKIAINKIAREVKELKAGQEALTDTVTTALVTHAPVPLPGPRTSYAAVAGHRTPHDPQNFPQYGTNMLNGPALRHTDRSQRVVDPSRSIVIHQIENPTRFRDTIDYCFETDFGR